MFVRNPEVMRILCCDSPEQLHAFLHKNRFFRYVIEYVFEFIAVGVIEIKHIRNTKDAMLRYLTKFCDKIDEASHAFPHQPLSEQPECMHWARKLVNYINEFSPIRFDPWIMNYEPPPHHSGDLELRKTVLRLEMENARLRARRGVGLSLRCTRRGPISKQRATLSRPLAARG